MPQLAELDLFDFQAQKNLHKAGFFMFLLSQIMII